MDRRLDTAQTAQSGGRRTGPASIGRRGLLTAAGAGAGGAVGTMALAACGPRRGDEAASQAAPSRATGTIEFWQWGVSYVDGFDALAAAFNEQHAGATVVHSRPEGYDDKIKVSIAAGSGGPDVYLMRGPNHKQWAHDGLAIDVGEYAARDKAAAADLRAMHKVFYDYYHYQGKLHGAPWDLSTISVAYNLDVLEARGLKPPAELGASWDWNAFADYARQLTPADGSKYGVDATPGIETGYYNWVVANGGAFWSDDYKRCTVDTPVFVEAAEAYMALAHRLKVSPPQAWTAEQIRGLPHRANLFTNGLVAMQTAGDWFFSWYDRVPDLRWDVVPVPYAPRTKQTGSIANFRGLAMAPTTRNKELAWAWMASLITREVQDRIPAMMGEVPGRLDSIEQVYLNPARAPTPKSRRLLKAAVEATRPLPGHPLLPWSDVNGAANALLGAYDGTRQVKDALTEIQAKLTALIEGR
ncbi:MAG TPA: sugar ABC transporter substrate-binding protein [Chloroflexota bacterium]|nr:sugar ABC transporter substrate-binding protein [Chloroflexota bacterium]